MNAAQNGRPIESVRMIAKELCRFCFSMEPPWAIGATDIVFLSTIFSGKRKTILLQHETNAPLYTGIGMSFISFPA
jgi:hypothetical protein